MDMIEIKKFSKDYGTFRAVKDLSLCIKKGEIVGFVGKNGAGKSTTIRTLLNMILPSEGALTIDSLDVTTHAKTIKERVAYVMSEPAYPHGVTSMELLMFSAGFSNSSKEDIEQLAQYFELNLDKKINELSLGNKKKVAIINALIKNAKIIILDEPTSGLDPLMQQKLFDLLLDAKKNGATIFLSSHNLQEVQRYCDKVAIIKDGQLVDYINLNDTQIKFKQVVFYRTKDGKEHTFDLEEDINLLLSRLSKLDIDHLEIKTKSVEDEFIQYYKDGAAHE